MLHDIYTLNVATDSEITSGLAESFRSRMFNKDAFIFRNLMDRTPQELIPEMPLVTHTMALKIGIKDSLVREEHTFDDLKEDPDLRILEKSGGTDISAFDFVDYKLHKLGHIVDDWGASEFGAVGPYCLAPRHLRRFLKLMEQLRASSFTKTTLSFPELFGE